MKKIFLSFLILLLVAAALLGCATAPPIRNPQITESNLPQKFFIDKVPMYKQAYMECGPTSLRMIMNFYGKNYSQEEIRKAKQKSYMSVYDMESYARIQSFEVYSFHDWKKSKIKYLIAQGYPLIVGGAIPSDWYKDIPTHRGRFVGEYHYAVITGYDDIEKVFVINEPGPGQKMKIPYEIFRDFHSCPKLPDLDNYVLCIFPRSK